MLSRPYSLILSISRACCLYRLSLSSSFSSMLQPSTAMASKPTKIHDLSFFSLNKSVANCHIQTGQYMNEDCILILANSPSLTLNILDKLWFQFVDRASSQSQELNEAADSSARSTKAGRPKVICADGAANRSRNLIKLHSIDSGVREDPQVIESKYIPDYIKGDLDSLTKDVQEFYESHGTVVIPDGNQDNNDLEKCLILASEISSNPVNTKIFVLGAFGGRKDQEFAAFHVMKKYSRVFDDIFLVDEGNIALILDSYYDHEVILCPIPHIKGPSIGLIPLFGPVDRVATSGLEWDLTGQRIAFGELVSTSNRLKDIISGELYNDHKRGYETTSENISDDEQVCRVVRLEISSDLLWTNSLEE